MVTIPVEALVLSGHQQTVYVLDGEQSRFTFATSRLGCGDRSWPKLRADFNSGDRVLIGGQEKYHEGEEVSPILASAPASETVQESGGMIDMKGAKQTRTTEVRK